MGKKNEGAGGWMSILSREVFGYLALLVVAGILTAVVNVGMTIVLKNLVDIAAGESALSLSSNILTAVALIVLEGAAGIITALCFRISVDKGVKRLRLKLCGKFYESDLAAVESRHVGEYMTYMTSDVENVASCIPSVIRNTVGNALTAVLAVAYLFFLSWKMALIMLISVPVLIVCIMAFSPLLQKASQKDKKNEENVRVFMQEMMQKITILKVCSMGRILNDKLEGLLDSKIKSGKRLGLTEGGSNFLNNIMGTAMMLIAIGGGAYLATRGELLVGSLIAVVQLTNYIVWPFVGTGEVVSQVNQSIASAKRLQTIEELEPGSLAEERARSQEKKDEKMEKLSLENISFGYGEKEVLKDITVRFEPDRLTGIVGESGSGKSTLLKVIAGLYRPSSGTIEAVYKNGDVYGGSMLPYVGFVPADQLVFLDTVKGNICMGKPVDEEKLIRCARLANIEEFINTLEKGYDTVIGDGKRSLSSGQEQRIAIARILYQDAEILLFDEPTANLDGESVNILKRTLKEIVKERICLVATHDKNLMEICDVLYEKTSEGFAEI